MRTHEIYFLCLLIFIAGCNQEDNKKITAVVQSERLIKPPLSNADVPYKEYSVDASKGDTLFYSSGSIILFPPNSFVDKNGKIISGQVQVKYRELSDPLDYYLSGVPMNYDSSGKQYTFISAAMCEITAFQNGTQLFVNPNAKPEINMATNDDMQSVNLYYLDTTKKEWINNGISASLKPGGKQVFKKGDTNASDTLSEMPVKPELANKNTPIIKIIIEKGSFP